MWCIYRWINDLYSLYVQSFIICAYPIFFVSWSHPPIVQVNKLCSFLTPSSFPVIKMEFPVFMIGLRVPSPAHKLKYESCPYLLTYEPLNSTNGVQILSPLYYWFWRYLKSDMNPFLISNLFHKPGTYCYFIRIHK